MLRRPVASPATMRDQIARLIEAAAQPDITIQLLPFTAGLHPAMYGMFNIFRFPDQQLPDIVYSETLTSACYLDKPDETARYTQALDQMAPRPPRLTAPSPSSDDILKET